MIVSINPSPVSGVVNAPASKSSMQRACAAALLSVGTTTILNPGQSNDDLAAIDVITKLGASIISQDNNSLVINSNGVQPASSSVNCGESGLGIRMFTPLAALSEKELNINGTGSLLKRPMHFFDDIFPSLGIDITSNKGQLPLIIRGPLKPANIEIDGSLSSQFLTGLLMGFAAAGADNVEIKVNNLKSKPYIDLTLDVMKQFGVEVENNNYESFKFGTPPPPGGAILPGEAINDPQHTNIESNEEPANSLPGGVDARVKGNTENISPRGRGGFIPTTYTVEGDWSGGAFLLVAGAIAGKIKVNGLNTHSTQADKEIMKALIDSGAEINISSNEIEIGPAALMAFSFDATDCPDLFPPLVALAAYCKGTTIIKGVSRLAHKESNRGLTLQDEFAKMGVKIELERDIMKVYGDRKVRGATVHSRHDHRIAMACAVAALKADGNTIIEEADAINKSYPDFYGHLASLGAIVNNKILQS